MTNFLSIDIDYCLSSSDFVDVFELFAKNCPNIKRKNLHYGQYHVDALDLIKKINTPINLYNIDLHHDIFYEHETSIAEVKSGIVSSANWVLWTLLNKRIESYTWIKQPSSEDFSEEMLELFNKAQLHESNYTIVDSRNVVFASKLAFAHGKEDSFIKQKPKIFTETRIRNCLSDINFDYIFFCLSPDYTPKEHHYLYDLLKISADSIFSKT